MLKPALIIVVAGIFSLPVLAVEPAAKAEVRPAAPFSESVMADGTLYLSGHIGADKATGHPPNDIETEARLAMDAVKRTVEKSGLSMDDLVSVTVYCTDLGLYDRFNDVYRTYFHRHFPARAFIGINALVQGAHFEVAGIAVRPAGAKKL